MWGAMLMGGRVTKISGTLTIGSSGTVKGYQASPAIGALSTTDIDGRTVTEVADDSSGTPSATVKISGFSSDPGAAFLKSIQVGSRTLAGTDADTYSLISGGVILFQWTGITFGLTSGTTSYTIETL